MKHLVVDARTALPAVDGLHTYLVNTLPEVCRAGFEAGRFRTTLLVNAAMEERWRELVPSATVVSSAIAPMRPQQNWQIPRVLRELRPDLYFYPAHDPPLLVGVPFVCTIHDVTLFRMRPYFERLDRPKLAYLRVVTTAALRRARAVFAVSESTKQEIGALFSRGLLPKVHVTPNGIRPLDPSFRREPEAARDRLLYVGTDRPHKNLHRLVRGYAHARRRRENLPRLEIIGGLRTPDDLRRTIREVGVLDHVVLRGHVPDAELQAAYARAVAFVFPSVAEGFGIPILEAMVRSVPVVTSNVSACAEVAGDAALTVDPFDDRAIGDAIARVHAEPELRDRLVARGHARAQEFTWQRTARGTYDVVDACLTRRP